MPLNFGMRPGGGVVVNPYAAPNTLGPTASVGPMYPGGASSPVGPPVPTTATIPGYKKGGKVKKTGIALVHKGERVLTRSQNRKFTKEHPAVKPSHKGRLHEALGVPADEKITIGELHSAMKSNSPHVRKMASYAETMRGWSHKGKK